MEKELKSLENMDIVQDVSEVVALKGMIAEEFNSVLTEVESTYAEQVKQLEAQLKEQKRLNFLQSAFKQPEQKVEEKQPTKVISMDNLTDYF